MKISYNWLKNFIEIESTPAEIAEWLTFSGTEVEEIIDTRSYYKGTLVGRVKEFTPHVPKDGVHKAKVQIEKDLITTALTEEKLSEGDLVAFAPVGATTPTNDYVEEVSLGDFVSEGIILTGEELGIPAHDEIIKFSEGSFQPGTLLEDALPLSDFILKLEVTPNRPDCLSHLGIAREIAAFNDNPLIYPSTDLRMEKMDTDFDISIQNRGDCSRYAGRVIEDVEVDKSPLEVGLLLSHLGYRSVNNVVDATNFVMLAVGNPLHAFDLDKLSDSQEIVVKRAEQGEKFVTLDNEVRELDDQMLCITDGEQKIALAGIMGGADSEVGELTTNLFLEAAYFDPIVVRKGRKKLDIQTESARRFERGVDPNSINLAMDLLTQKIVDWSDSIGGISEVVDNYQAPVKAKEVSLRGERVNSILGANIPIEEGKEILGNLEFEIIEEDGDDLEIAVPTFRPDVSREIDLIEEIGRIHGYDKIEPAERTQSPLSVEREYAFELQSKISNFLSAKGLSEIVSHPFGSKEKFTEFADEKQLVRVSNPVSKKNEVLRPSLVPSVLKCISRNIKNKNYNVNIFEVGKIYRREGDEDKEKKMLCLGITGKKNPPYWSSETHGVDFFDIKGILDELLQKLNIPNTVISESENCFYQDIASFDVSNDGSGLGSLGLVKAGLLEKYDIEQDVYLLNLDFERLKQLTQQGEIKYNKITKYPYIQRDLTINIPESIKAREICKTITKSGAPMIEDIQQIDLYRGENIPADKKSYTFRIKYQSNEKTLTDEEVNDVHFEVIHTLEEELDAELPEG